MWRRARHGYIEDMSMYLLNKPTSMGHGYADDTSVFISRLRS